MEIGLLGEVFRNCATRRVCAVDLCERYDHKHQPLSQQDPGTGLMRMAIGIAGKAVLEDPLGAPQIPNGSRVTSAVPEIVDRIKEAVADDAK